MQNSIPKSNQKVLLRIAAMGVIGISIPICLSLLPRHNTTTQMQANPTTVEAVTQDLTARYPASGSVLRTAFSALRFPLSGRVCPGLLPDHADFPSSSPWWKTEWWWTWPIFIPNAFGI